MASSVYAFLFVKQNYLNTTCIVVQVIFNQAQLKCKFSTNLYRNYCI